MLKNSGIPNVVLAASIEFFFAAKKMGSDKDSTVSGLRSKRQQR